MEDEGHIVADLSILEFYLHRSIQLRLDAFGKTNAESQSELKQAHFLTVIVSDMMKMLMNMLGGSFEDVPLDPILKLRLNFGGALGHLLFNDAQTLEKRLEAMAKALPVVNQLVATSGCKPLEKPLLELKKIMLLWSSQSNVEAIEEFESIFGHSLSVEDKELGKQALLNEEDFQKTRNEVLSELNLQIFDTLVIEGLRQVYRSVEPPLIAKMAKSQLNSLAASKEKIELEQHDGPLPTEESQPTVNLYTQVPFMTQNPTQDLPTQVFQDTQDRMPTPSLSPSSTAGILATEVTWPASTQATSETMEPLMPSPAALLRSTQDSELVQKIEPPVTQAAEPEKDVDSELEQSIDSESDEEAGLESGTDDQPAQASFEPATQMPFDDENIDLELKSLKGPEVMHDALLADEEEEEEIITKFPFEFFSELLKFCEEDPKEFFSARNETISNLYEKYREFKEECEADKALPSIESLLPRESLQIPPAVKKRVVFESEADFEEPPTVQLPALKKAKKSMLLPNETSKKVDWDSLIPSSPSKENKLPGPNSDLEELEEPLRLTKKQSKGRRPFTDEEVANLVDGVRKYGRKWAVILTCYKFNDRTSVDLKDKARNLAKKGVIILPAVFDE